MSFVRKATERWHREIPGARWLKADLHVHTIDDCAGGKAKMPDAVPGSPQNHEVLGRYARHVLQSAASRGVEVIGLTPHSPRVDSSSNTSAVWKIVDEWKNGVDEDGTPFREKIYAVFPGFEPSLRTGSEGLHLLFLFDPEIGCDRYFRLFDSIMGGASPWRDKTLQISSKSAEDVFNELKTLHERESSNTVDGRQLWQYLILAPHIDSPKGLLETQKAQILELFDHGEIAGLELGDQKLPEETLRDRGWLRDGMRRLRQAFFHGSDAYTVEDIGRRYTWLKLASPRIEALRQAFIASDSRMRIAFHRDEEGSLQEIADPPDVTRSKRPWLKMVTVRGGASFFGGREEDRPRETRFELSPDLTCVIGGSMTGKSTFLDGLRVHVGAPMPQDSSIAQQVEARGRERFLAGAPDVLLDCPGADSTAPPHEQWPAVFFAQNELNRLSQESEAVEEILARLVPSETGGIEQRAQDLERLDRELTSLTRLLAELDEQLGEAEQAYERAKTAKEELEGFSEAGVTALHRSGRRRQAWEEARAKADELREQLGNIVQSARELEIPAVDAHGPEALEEAKISAAVSGLSGRWEEIITLLESTRQKVGSWTTDAAETLQTAGNQEQQLHETVVHRLTEMGLDAGKLREFKALNQQASLLPSYEANLNQVRTRRSSREDTFERMLDQRANLVRQQRDAFDRVIAQIEKDFLGHIRASRIDGGNRKPLESFIHALGQRGITRWWNNFTDEDDGPGSVNLLEALDQNKLSELKMSSAVEETFREVMTKANRRELAALRCSDRYVLRLRMDDGSFRRLDSLSGGQRVSVLLSLLLETSDDRPLVIDQPEDELDNRFLFETVLPALKKLKGKRQVIVATHNANIVVNGDADMVIQLEATANHGHIAQNGAIEEPLVRDAIVRTVDGGDEAFRLRRLKYGF